MKLVLRREREREREGIGNEKRINRAAKGRGTPP